MKERLRRWLGVLPPSAEAGSEAEVLPPAPVQSRRRALDGGRGSLWTEEPETCEVCGRRLLTGELPALFQVADDMVLACPICAMDLATAGFRSAKPSTELAA